VTVGIDLWLIIRCSQARQTGARWPALSTSETCKYSSTYVLFSGANYRRKSRRFLWGNMWGMRSLVSIFWSVSVFNYWLRKRQYSNGVLMSCPSQNLPFKGIEPVDGDTTIVCATRDLRLSVIAALLITHDHGGMARLSWPRWLLTQRVLLMNPRR